jgi:hypothetical protein
MKEEQNFDGLRLRTLSGMLRDRKPSKGKLLSMFE